MKTKKLSLQEMEQIDGGGFIDGACKVLGFTGAGIGIRAMLGAVAIPGWGLVVLGVGAAACLVYQHV